MKAPKQVNVHEAKTRLSQLLAEVEGGREIVVARNGKPVAKLVPFAAEGKKKLRLGTWKGRIWMSPDFDAPLSPEELKAWGY
ncbi:MAG: type II toxin-antitoxin system prevent-host-death family antitoxin [Acidobacteriota bacterium]|nr:type II toxin-antitoxin system prevent-host-death family antitoxin [Acidobacteriota bacterium]